MKEHMFIIAISGALGLSLLLVGHMMTLFHDDKDVRGIGKGLVWVGILITLSVITVGLRG